jgi:DNA-directed RNA polymerase specialized sigma24 family protein
VAARWTRLLRTAYLLVQDWPTAEDLTQAALVKAWLAWPRLDDDPEAYVRKIIVTTHVSWWRRGGRRREEPADQPPERAGGGSETDGVDDRDAVWRALGRLPARQRAVVVLRFFTAPCAVGIQETASGQLQRLRATRKADDPDVPHRGA